MAYKIQKEVTKSQALIERDKKVVAPCLHLTYYPLAVESAHGDILTDVDGNEYIDFFSAASSLNLGSSFPPVVEALEKQLKKCTEYTPPYAYTEPMVAYAERLTSIFPGGGAAKVAFGHCGSDANDGAVKFARAYTGRPKIITFINGYHGNTYGASSLTTTTPRMRAKMGPFLPDIYHFPFYGEDVPNDIVERNAVRAMEQAFSLYLPPEEVAAVIIEPIQGDAGILPAHPVFMKKLYDLCRAHGILFIVEEVQQGFWRAGHWFSIENYPGILPDGVIMGKSLGAGLPMGAFMGRADIMDSLPAPAHSFTLAGNPMAAVAGLTAFDYYLTGEFREIYHRNCEAIRQELAALKAKHPGTVSFYRGRGMSWGIGIGKDGVPDGDGAYKICFRAYEKGLVINTLAGSILRVQPPLNMEADHMRRGFAILDEAMTDLEAGAIPDDVFAYRHGW